MDQTVQEKLLAELQRANERLWRHEGAHDIISRIRFFLLGCKTEEEKDIIRRLLIFLEGIEE